jgi:CubicO group peptidase (beta-lactamase class C family)
MKKVGIFGVFLFLLTTNAEAFQFEKTLANYGRERGKPGLAAMVLRDGKAILWQGYGETTSPQGSRPISTASNFNLASVSKQFTAFLVLKLEAKKLLRPQDSIRRVLTELPALYEPITIEQLVHHTSGLPEYFRALCAGPTPVKNVEVLRFLRMEWQKLEFTPGSQYRYSNTGYVLLSEIVSRLSGKSFPELMKAEIFAPLGMDSSQVFTSETQGQIKHRAYARSPWPFFKLSMPDGCDDVFGDGGVYTSLQDYAIWTRELEHPTLLPVDLHSKLFQVTTLPDGSTNDYGYGWGIETLPRFGKVIGHSGSWNGYRARAAFHPESKTWIVLFSNYEGVDLGALGRQMMSEMVP